MTPKCASRTTLDSELTSFLSEHPSLRLGGPDLHGERRHHTEAFGFTAHPPHLLAPFAGVEFTTVRGFHGNIPLRILYPSKESSVGTIYFHGGGCTVATTDEFENGCRILAEKAGVQA
jgi:acetyl esterase/lipase